MRLLGFMRTVCHPEQSQYMHAWLHYCFPCIVLLKGKYRNAGFHVQCAKTLGFTGNKIHILLTDKDGITTVIMCFVYFGNWIKNLAVMAVLWEQQYTDSTKKEKEKKRLVHSSKIVHFV